MSTTITNYSGVAVLTVKEDLAGEAVAGFLDRGMQCAKKGEPRIVLDCSALSGVDSSGLEALIDLQNACENELGAVKLCGLNATCAKILEITRLARRFEVFEELESAVKSFL